MLPQTNRLRKEKDIKTLFTKGKSVFVPGCVLRLRKNMLPSSRFAYVIGNKISKSAVVRNRLRRRMRAIIHEWLVDIPVGFDVVFILRKEALSMDFEQIKQMTKQALRKSRLL